MAAQGNIDKPFNAFNASFKNKLNDRRDARIPYRAAFRLLWDEQSSQPKYARALGNDVSENGLSFEMSQSIPVGTRIALRADGGELFGSALVKHVTKRGTTYVLGVQLSYGLRDDALALVREVYSTPRAKQ